MLAFYRGFLDRSFSGPVVSGWGGCFLGPLVTLVPLRGVQHFDNPAFHLPGIPLRLRRNQRSCPVVLLAPARCGELASIQHELIHKPCLTPTPPYQNKTRANAMIRSPLSLFLSFASSQKHASLSLAPGAKGPLPVVVVMEQSFVYKKSKKGRIWSLRHLLSQVLCETFHTKKLGPPPPSELRRTPAIV